MHMDEVVARRTLAGKPALHGMNGALWSLDRLAEAGFLAGTFGECKIRFRELVYVGDTASLWVVRDDGAKLSAELRVGNLAVTTVSLVRATERPQGIGGSKSAGRGNRSSAATIPEDLPLQSLAGRTGFIPMADCAETMYPFLARRFGRSRVNGMAALSYLVGMICPGLHSVFYSCSIEFTDGGEQDRRLAFQVDEVDERVRLINETVNGGGISATVVAGARLPPVAQAGMEEIAALIKPGEFAGAVALVIGGSRGLGELTAKVIAAGGGKVIITYAVGKTDADAVCAEIRQWGGECAVIPYDVCKSPELQLDALAWEPSHLYYFATSPIVKQLSKAFSATAFAEYCQYYVRGFSDLCVALRKRRDGSLRVFYPSSIFVAERPAGMTEYAMAKASGEVLCEDIGATLAGLSVVAKRLPRVLTDQTAGAILGDTENPLGVMLSVVRDVQSAASRDHTKRYSAGSS